MLSLTKLKKNLQESFAIDLRALAAFRMGLGILLIADLAQRSLTLKEHYSDAGMFPRSVLGAVPLERIVFSLHTIAGSVEAQGFLFVVAGLFALALAIGFWTRTATVISYLFLSWLQTRNPFVLHFGDLLLLILLFWGMFLPLGARFSMDAGWRVPKSRKSANYFSVATVALLGQMLVIYLTTALHKWAAPVWRDGYAMAINLDTTAHVTVLGHSLLAFPALLKVMTYTTPIIQFFGPLLMVLPKRGAKIRLLATFALLYLHVGIGLFFSIGLFPYISLVSLCCFLPSGFWDKLEGALRRWLPSGESPAPVPLGKVPKFIVLVSFTLILFSNGHGLFHSRSRKQGPLFFFYQTLPFDQKWVMFSNPLKRKRGWFVLQGILENGEKKDLVRRKLGKKDLWPATFSDTFPNFEMQVYLANVANSSYRFLRRPLVDFLCRERGETARPEHRLKRVDYLQFDRLVRSDYSIAVPQGQVVFSLPCTP